MSNDLQTLYKMRDIFKKEEYVKSYNAKVNEDLRAATNARVSKEMGAKNTAYNNWNNAFADKISSLNLRGVIIGAIFALIGVFLFPLIADLLCENDSWGRLYCYITALWMSVITAFSFVGNHNYSEFSFNNVKINAPKNTKKYKGLTTVIFIALIAFYFISAIGKFDNFDSGFLGVIVMLFWPIANFFIIGKASWLMLLVVVLIFVWYIFLVGTPMGCESNASRAFSDSNVRNLYNVYNNAVAVYNQAYNQENAKIKGQYTALLKPDTSAQEKRALESVIPKQFQDIDTVNKWIWCIEQKYANTIVEARNWYLQQAQNAAIQQKLATVASEMRRSNEIAAQAAADAKRAHEESMRAAAKTQKSLDKLNATARENANTNKDIANSVDKIYTEIKY